MLERDTVNQMDKSGNDPSAGSPTEREYQRTNRFFQQGSLLDSRFLLAALVSERDRLSLKLMLPEHQPPPLQSVNLLHTLCRV
jgi:hypothetical protein